MASENVFTGDFERRFGLLTTERRVREYELLSWGKIPATRLTTFRSVIASQEPTLRAAGKPPYIAFSCGGWEGTRVTSGQPIVDQFVAERVGGWSQVDEVHGKIHPTLDGEYEFANGQVIVKGACLAFTKYSPRGVQAFADITRPGGVWRIPRIILTQGYIHMS